MSVKSTYVAVGIFLSLFIALALCRETCYRRFSVDLHCSDGYECCDGNTNCCSQMYRRKGSSTGPSAAWAYIGIGIGSIVGLIILVAIIAAICSAVMKKKNHAGRVIQPVGGTTAQVVTVQNPQGYSMPRQPSTVVQPLSVQSAAGPNSPPYQ